jgi:hypothetical protein
LDALPVIPELIRNPVFFIALTTTTRTPAGTAGIQTGCQFEAVSHSCDNVIDCNRFRQFKQVFVDHERNTVFLEYFILFFGLIQSHSQRGTSSPALHHHDPDFMGLVLVFKKFIEHLDGFFRYFKHGFLLIGNIIF